MSAYSDKVLADGATAYWRLGETSGTVANDSKGTAHGTISGGVTLGQPGATTDGDTAMRFDSGANSLITMPAGVAVFGAGAFSVECWVYHAVGGGPATQALLDDTLGASTAGFNVFVSLSNGRPGFRVANGTTFQQITAIVAVMDAKWHHLVCVLERGASDFARIYVDGVLLQSGTLPATGWLVNESTPLKLGTYAFNATSRWLGSIDEVAIYPRALTPAEVTAHYVAGTSLLPGDKTTLWAKWMASTQNWNNEEHAAALGGFPPKDLTTVVQKFLGQG